MQQVEQALMPLQIHLKQMAQQVALTQEMVVAVQAVQHSTALKVVRVL
jgi:hypothetical protein